MLTIKIKASALSLAILFSFSASAQDIIVKKDGNIIRAVVTKVSESDVEYRNFGSSSERIYSIKTSSIVSINYEDGTTDNFSSEESAPTSVASESGTTKAIPDVKMNNELIEAYNFPTPEFGGVFAKEGDRAFYGLVHYAVSDGSILVSDDLIISMEAGNEGINGYQSTYSRASVGGHGVGGGIPNIIFTVTNRTERTLYLDLGNTFLTVGGHSQAYYIPGAQSTTSTTGKGASVNMGAVAGALGVGGAVGTLANGINVGGGNSTSSNNVVFNQRILAVAPFSKLSLERQSMQDNDFLFVRKGYDSNYIMIYTPERLFQGHPFKYSEQTSPSKLSFFLSYSYSEDCENLKQMSVNLYAKVLYALSPKTVFDWKKYLSLPVNAVMIINPVSEKR